MHTKIIAILIVLFVVALLMGVYHHRMPPFEDIPQKNRHHDR
jgi:hypothetical protein